MTRGTHSPDQLLVVDDADDFDADDAVRDEDDVAGLGRRAQLGVRDADLCLARLDAMGNGGQTQISLECRAADVRVIIASPDKSGIHVNQIRS